MRTDIQLFPSRSHHRVAKIRQLPREKIEGVFFFINTLTLLKGKGIFHVLLSKQTESWT